MRVSKLFVGLGSFVKMSMKAFLLGLGIKHRIELTVYHCLKETLERFA